MERSVEYSSLFSFLIHRFLVFGGFESQGLFSFLRSKKKPEPKKTPVTPSQPAVAATQPAAIRPETSPVNPQALRTAAVAAKIQVNNDDDEDDEPVMQVRPITITSPFILGGGPKPKLDTRSILGDSARSKEPLAEEDEFDF